MNLTRLQIARRSLSAAGVVVLLLAMTAMTPKWGAASPTAAFGVSEGSGKIAPIDYESASPNMEIGDVKVTEGNGGQTKANLVVTLDKVSATDVTVDFVTEDGTAKTSDSDYKAASGTLTIPAGDLFVIFHVFVIGDTNVEPNEDFFVKLSNPSAGVTITRDKGTVTINDDDGPTATLLLAFHAEPIDGGVELRWQLGGSGESDRVSLERGVTQSGPWAEVIGERRSDGELTVMVDRGAEAGRTYYYRLTVTSLGGQTLTFGPFIGTAGSSVKEFALSSLWPNPTPGITRIEFAVAREVPVKLSLFDVQGREVSVLAEGIYRPGRYQAVWNGQTDSGVAPAGVYFVRYQTPSGDFVRRLVLQR